VATDPVPGRNRRIGRNELHAIAVVTATQAPFKQILDAIKCLLLLQVPLNFVAKRLFPQSFHRIINPGYPLFYHFFVAADPGFLRTPAAATPEGRLTGVGGCRIGNGKIVDRLEIGTSVLPRCNGVNGSRRVAAGFVLGSGKPA
jgi:hypothetical protein